MSRMRPALWFGVALWAAAATPTSAGSPEDVQALVERAAGHIREVGRQQAFADFNRADGGFTSGELYVFCNDSTGKVLAHGDNPALVGRSLLQVKDGAGNSPTSELARTARDKGQGWVEYLWPNKQLGRVQHKVTFVMRIDDQTFCASGYYKPDQQ